MTGPRPIRVTIDRLVLHGIDRADAAAVKLALAAEVRSALAAAGACGIEASRGLADQSLTVPSASDPALLGRSAGAGIGSALVSGLGKDG